MASKYQPNDSGSSPINTSQFKKDEAVELKLKRKKGDLWVAGKVASVGSKHIRVEYISNKKIYSLRVKDTEYHDKIRIIDNAQDDHEDSDQSDVAMEDKKEETEPKDIKKDEHDNNDNWSISGYLYNKFVGEEPKPPKKVKKVKKFDEKAITEWSRKDVVAWMESMSSYAPYADNIPKHMDGKELLDTTIDDLALIIPKKLWRRKFMQQIELAKKTYVASESNDNEEEEDDDNKEKEQDVNGIVGLRNLGATCYMNTSIQIMSQSPYITRYLKKRAKMTSNTTKYGQYPMLNAWTDLCDVIYNRKPSKWNAYTVKSPAAIRDALKEIDPEFGSGAQDDSSRSLSHMLQALDEEIDREIKSQKRKSKAAEYRDSISIYDGKELNEMETKHTIDELLSGNNPFNSIVKKTFDGIEHQIYECLECHHKFQQFATFRIVDLALVSHEIQIKNIHVVCNNQYHHIPFISMLGYCSMHLLQYHVMQFLLKQYPNQNMAHCDCNIVIISTDGKVDDVNECKLSEIQNLSGALFVLINKNMASKNELGRILQIDLAVAVNKTSLLSIKYNQYDANEICKLARSQIATYHEQMNDDENHDYYVNYNGNVFDTNELKRKNIQQNMHNIDGINVLFVLRVNSQQTKYFYDINDFNLKIKLEAEDNYENSSTLNALAKFKSLKIKRRNKWSKRNDYDTIEDEVESEINRIGKTIRVLQAKQNIVDMTNNFLRFYDAFSTTTYRELGDLTECLAEYEKANIFDESCYAYPCSNCKPQSNSLWVKVQKKIVYSPPVFLFHLDRYGKNMAVNHVKSRSNSYRIGQQLMVNYGGKAYNARILKVNSNGMRIEYSCDKTQEWIAKSNYFNKLASNSGGYRYNGYASNKFDHNVHYKMRLNTASNHVYDLFGISNHSGSTSGGHYTATIKCLTDGKWYDISDSHVSNKYVKPLSHAQSVTILAYARKQD